MTTPEQEETPPEEAPYVEAVAAILVVGAAAAATAAAIAAALIPLRLSTEAIGAATRVALSVPFPTPPGASGTSPGTEGPPGAESAPVVTGRREVYYRAAYLVNASKRIFRAVREGATLREAAAREKRYFQSHLDAAKNRAAKARAVDAAARRYGDLLGWRAVMDQRTSGECRAAHRKNFRASRKPAIGYPGTVHPHCRCVPGPPIPGAAELPTRRRRRR